MTKGEHALMMVISVYRDHVDALKILLREEHRKKPEETQVAHDEESCPVCKVLAREITYDVSGVVKL